MDHDKKIEDACVAGLSAYKFAILEDIGECRKIDIEGAVVDACMSAIHSMNKSFIEEKAKSN